MGDFCGPIESVKACARELLRWNEQGRFEDLNDTQLDQKIMKNFIDYDLLEKIDRQWYVGILRLIVGCNKMFR